MGTTAHRATGLGAAAAVSLGLLLSGAGTATADEPGAPATQGSITLTPEQAVQVCTRRIPATLARIDRVTERIDDDASTPGSTAWLQARLDQAQAAGRTQEADRLRLRIDGRAEKLDRLADAQAQVTAFRDANCAA
jgi:hypothetical protein